MDIVHAVCGTLSSARERDPSTWLPRIVGGRTFQPGPCSGAHATSTHAVFALGATDLAALRPSKHRAEEPPCSAGATVEAAVASLAQRARALALCRLVCWRTL